MTIILFHPVFSRVLEIVKVVKPFIIRSLRDDTVMTRTHYKTQDVF
jgi:hypothetical protein